LDKKAEETWVLNVGESRNEVFNSLKFRKVDMPLADCNHAIEHLIRNKMRRRPIKSRGFCKICTLIIDLRWICLVEDVVRFSMTRPFCHNQGTMKRGAL
jgi:hypothetical protein